MQRKLLSPSEASKIYDERKNCQKDDPTRLVYVYSFGTREIGQNYLKDASLITSMIAEGTVRPLNEVMSISPEETQACLNDIQQNARHVIERSEKIRGKNCVKRKTDTYTFSYNKEIKALLKESNAEKIAQDENEENQPRKRQKMASTKADDETKSSASHAVNSSSQVICYDDDTQCYASFFPLQHAMDHELLEENPLRVPPNSPSYYLSLQNQDELIEIDDNGTIRMNF